MVTQDRLDWPRAIHSGGDHVIDFGPGDYSGAGCLVDRVKGGLGVRVLLASVLKGNGHLASKLELFDRGPACVPRSISWKEQFSPLLARTPSGRIMVDTKMTRLLGLLSIMIAGMTPTTSDWKFVSHTMNSGYHIEFACGGHHDAKSLSNSIKKLAAKHRTGARNHVQCDLRCPCLLKMADRGANPAQR